jgi:hypothetical protein
MVRRCGAERKPMNYQLNQVIHYMRDNKPHGAPVLARMQVENLREDWACTQEQRNLFTPFGPAGVYYATCHGLVHEREAFASKAEMLESMASA